MAARLCRALARKKTLDDEDSQLARVLNLMDLTALGVGSTLGLGVYVLAGSVARNEAGPAVCLSFLVAAIASAFAGLCYAEFASRVPKAGSAYVYSYVSVGEFSAFIIGWNLILEYVIGTASVARGLSNYIDALTNNTMKKTLTELMPINADFMSPYPDFLSFFVVMLLTVLLAVGVKESTNLNNIFTVFNLVTVSVVFVAGVIKADTANWKIAKEDIPEGVKGGEGGFLPFGVAGVMAGAAKCFYGFVGFDCVATTGEEAKKPQKNIPLAIIFSLIIIFLAYFGVSTVLTMMWPYYDQDANAPFPYVFEKVGWPVIKWIVTIGAIFALCTSMLGAMFPLPRVIYAMSNDGLLFKFLASVHPKTQTPIKATIISGIFSGIMAAIFDLQQLVDMMSIGTLLAYTIVAICVLILRYDDNKNYEDAVKTQQKPELSLFDFFRRLFNLNMTKEPSRFSSGVTNWSVSTFCILAAAICANIIYSDGFQNYYSLISFVVLVIVTLITIFIIYRQPVHDIKLAFKVPCVPLLPCLSILINLYLMMELDLHTWIRFVVWLVIGFLIYFFYGIRNSTEGENRANLIGAKRPSLAATISVKSEKKLELETDTKGRPNEQVTKF
ncbi:PREDICTED: cationic amino acid transporter 2 isoform X2 [Nicrophorus vespilloides]|uniref:Cationic amino acid transporter 2 isoform X2 n=1 Tax=Nicrophorus vespilloides TaxID=110193 RepID=A0ABM1MRJ1_NICVS|nr:PREDICTED: cationic amino acid transporter 2 isoform X2 [Nicrophorus vespilloides]